MDEFKGILVIIGLITLVLLVVVLAGVLLIFPDGKSAGEDMGSEPTATQVADSQRLSYEEMRATFVAQIPTPTHAPDNGFGQSEWPDLIQLAWNNADLPADCTESEGPGIVQSPTVWGYQPEPWGGAFYRLEYPNGEWCANIDIYVYRNVDRANDFARWYYDHRFLDRVEIITISDERVDIWEDFAPTSNLILVDRLVAEGQVVLFTVIAGRDEAWYSAIPSSDVLTLSLAQGLGLDAGPIPLE